MMSKDILKKSQAQNRVQRVHSDVKERLEHVLACKSMKYLWVAFGFFAKIARVFFTFFLRISRPHTMGGTDTVWPPLFSECWGARTEPAAG